MQTLAEQIETIEDSIRNFEKHILDTKVTDASLTKAQAYVDSLDERYGKELPSQPKLAARLYEFQALLDYAKGNVKRAQAFLVEARNVAPDQAFVSGTMSDLGGAAPAEARADGSAPAPAGDGPKYFVVNPWRLAGLSLLTWGIYTCYWFYKNWKAIGDYENKNQHPVLSAIFAPLVSYSLFNYLKKDAARRGVTTPFSAGGRAWAFFLLNFFTSGFLSFIPLIGTQNIMKQLGAPQKEDFGPGEIILLIIGIVYWLFVIIGAAADTNNTSTGTKRSTGYVASREIFVSSCVNGALEEQTLTYSQATSYCGCVYDTGIERYGGQEFTSMTVDLGKTENFTPAYNALVNECLGNIESI